MSLKAFHLVFVTSAIAVAVFLGVWAYLSYETSHSRTDLTYVIASALSVVALLWYGRYFLKKLKHISYL
jgi:hypothetical protein